MKLAEEKVLPKTDLSDWLKCAVDVIQGNKEFISKIIDPNEKYDKICDIHCGNSCLRLAKHKHVEKLFKEGQITIYGLMYNPGTGELGSKGYLLNKDNINKFDITKFNTEF